MSLLAATWIGAIATVLLAVGAGLTAAYAIKAYRKQSQQTQLLQQQAARDIEQRRRAQASRVFTWIEQRPFNNNPEDPRAAACVSNTSNQPVYDIVLGLGQREDQHWPLLMPGGEHVMPGLGTTFASDRAAVWITFRDSAGLRWLATGDGQLTEFQESST